MKLANTFENRYKSLRLSVRMSKKFQRKVENFECANCGHGVEGNGYTNHCPNCLWSKHVDINPGDRASSCGGLMEPAGILVKVDRCIITHRCQQCGFVRKQKTSVNDNFDSLIDLTVSQERTGYGVHGFRPNCDSDQYNDSGAYQGDDELEYEDRERMAG